MSMHDLHTRVAAAILAQLETADPASWTPPWHGADPMPRNARTGRRYRGINVLALWCAAQSNGYADARWATYRQWAALGAQVRKAERGTLVLFYKDLPHSARVETGGTDLPDGAPFVARAAHVFNVAQVDAAPPAANVASSMSPATPLPTFDAFVTATGAHIKEGGAHACYVPATDTIHLPPRAAFHTPTGYAGTLAHELIHWTGAPTGSLATSPPGSAPAPTPLRNLWPNSAPPSCWQTLALRARPTPTTPPTARHGRRCCAPTPAPSATPLRRAY